VYALQACCCGAARRRWAALRACGVARPAGQCCLSPVASRAAAADALALARRAPQVGLPEHELAKRALQPRGVYCRPGLLLPSDTTVYALLAAQARRPTRSRADLDASRATRALATRRTAAGAASRGREGVTRVHGS
jgi:hypothetical protein